MALSRKPGLAAGSGPDQDGEINTAPDPGSRHRFPAEIISHAVWLYHVFSPNFRDVELILAGRGVIVSYESIRQWCLKFGASFAARLRRRRPRPGDKLHLDEVFTRIGGEFTISGAPSIRMASCPISWCRAGAMPGPRSAVSGGC